MKKQAWLVVVVLAGLFAAEGAAVSGEPGASQGAKRESVLDYLPAFGSVQQASPVPERPVEAPQAVYVSGPGSTYSPAPEAVEEAPRESLGGMVGNFLAWFPRKTGQLFALAGDSVASVAYTGGDFVATGVSALDPTTGE